jgi:putative sugar O-methyltransferase
MIEMPIHSNSAAELVRAEVPRIRAAIAAMRSSDKHFAAQPGRMWRENVQAFEYLLSGVDLSPFEMLRRHTHHITGDPGRKLPRILSGRARVSNILNELALRLGFVDSRTERAWHFRTWLRNTPASLPLASVVTEPPVLGGGEIVSSVIDGQPYNFETARFLVELVNIAEWGAVPFDQPGLRIMDLGSGWGGLAYFLRALYPDSHITLLDLPETFIFSMPYLMLGDPDRTFYFAEDGFGDPSAAVDADYAFFSPGALERIPDRSFDLIINTGSMAEMSQDQVQFYISQIKRIGRGAFYSFNEDRQDRNVELENLTEILDREFSITNGRHTFAPFRSIACTW